MDCVFCKIVDGKIPAKVIMESKNSIAFLDAFPVAEGHTLVIPKKHYEKLQFVSSEDNADLFGLVHKIIPKVDALTGASLVAIHNGKEAGQEVPHVHIHLIPRHQSDSAGAVHSMFANRPKLTDSEFSNLQEKLKTL
ncbi:HIT family protein [Candidatus Nitrosotenuis cloacae]|uniref:HIT family hydrolase n=1 Tax=Candidatus Nitrosotenuis cloacae TaxID=1603555 RepID=A0A3G1B325_9ARCH|nr:HIT family protein [Candidatus Nitrosotenuis cloacae]AJZ76542.1 HIT family hydrolase [Candidatus Nitrosotenuis cloacae]